ncbi:hypothetical protein NDU88_006367 [Pleurodeles waltl]|uniref:Uncharacterized protein n=1 Tax=Pleurodeles waltl TaxID=8319 RepID=A0AAV7PL77_PLEWA|nr:hypothetical protein NDU88_006367 [Pleurodeles waltl]
MTGPSWPRLRPGARPAGGRVLLWPPGGGEMPEGEIRSPGNRVKLQACPAGGRVLSWPPGGGEKLEGENRSPGNRVKQQAHPAGGASFYGRLEVEKCRKGRSVPPATESNNKRVPRGAGPFMAAWRWRNAGRGDLFPRQQSQTTSASHGGRVLLWPPGGGEMREGEICSPGNRVKQQAHPAGGRVLLWPPGGGEMPEGEIRSPSNRVKR